jgi:hypothetical protein
VKKLTSRPKRGRVKDLRKLQALVKDFLAAFSSK